MTTTQVPEWTLGDRLRKAREHAGLKQDDVAAILNVSPATVSNWENGARRPRHGELDLVARWAEETGVDELWLLKGVGVRNCWLPPGAPDELFPFEAMDRQTTHSATGATHRDAA